jgi:diguanylate cyclase (GGDEF)-like protein/PAS domain S-box-containing protein
VGPAIDDGAPMSRRDAFRFAVVNPTQIVPFAVVGLFWAAYQNDWVTNEVPFLSLAVAVLFAQLASTISFVAWPAGCTELQLSIRLGLVALSIALILYITGWGMTLGVGFAFVAAEAVRTDGSRAARLVTAWMSLLVLVGEIFVETGTLPTLLPPERAHGIALLAFVGTTVLIELIRSSAQEKEEATASLRRSEERFRALVLHATDVVLVVDRDAHVKYASPSMERALGYEAEELSLILADVVHPDDLARTREFFGYLTSRPDEVSYLEVRIRHADGTWRWFEVGASNRLADAAVEGIVCNMRDVTERVQFEDELSRQAFHDPVTGMPNRASFLQRLDEALDVVRRYHGHLAVLFLDLDRFKIVNDTLGHEIGDRLLRAIAQRLRETLRPDDVIARFGGDEFTILRPLVHGPDEAYALADELLEAMRSPVLVEGHELVVAASIGVTTSQGEDEAGDLLRQSDLAMYVAKENGRARWEAFDGTAAAPYAERLEVERDLRRAFDNGELVVYYQPEVDLETGVITTCEALLRWAHPTRGLLSPSSFIPFAEETTLILDIDRYLLRVACRQAREWDDARHGQRPLVVSMNLSPRFLRQPDAVDALLDILQETGVDPRRLQLEITERTALDDLEGTVTTLMSVRALGVRIAIDDFGTGYSSLSYLKQLPVDVVKLDRGFVEAMDTDDADLAIVQAVITMGHALGMKVTAEGVERIEQAERLVALGCDTAIGFFWSKAVPAPAFARLRRRGFAVHGTTQLSAG